MTDTKSEQKRIKKIKPLHIVIIVIIAVLVLCALNLCAEVFMPRPARDIQNTTTGHFLDSTIDVSQIDIAEKPAKYYDGVEEAIRSSRFYKEDSLAFNSDEITRFEDEQSLTSIRFGTNSEGQHCIYAFCFDKQGARISNLILYRRIDLTPGEKLIPNYQFTNEDAVAFYINDSIIALNAYSRANNDKWTAVGVSESDSIYSLRILGESPTEIIRAYDGSKEYYIWYYIGLDMRQILWVY